jgi:hypothetical protein
MSDSYLDGKVREALLAAKGSRTLAQNTLIAWAAKDDRLLRTMVQPFIKAISGDAIARAIKRGVTVPGLGGPPPKARPAVSQDDLRRVLSQMGGGDTGGGEAGEDEEGLTPAGILGTDARASVPSRRPEPSTSPVGAKPVVVDQAKAIRTLAAVYARNRKQP